MNIVLEGPDNAGKTTLADILADKTGYLIKTPEGPCRTDDEVTARCKDYFENHPNHTIFDRHPVISQPIYRNLHGTPDVPSHWAHLLYAQKPLIIYCRPPEGRTAAGQVIKERDDPEDIARIERNYDWLIQLYDEWAVRHANLIYRIGDNTDDFCRRVVRQMRPEFDPIGDIRAFHEKFKIDYRGKPRMLPQDLQDFRIKFMREEVDEYELALNTPGDISKSLHDSLDALVDLVYVALGTSHMHGFNFAEAWRRVHLANMMKRRTLSASDSKRGSTYDVVKPEGWQPPDHTDLIEDHAHK